MSKKKGNGCAVAAIVGAGVGLLLIVGVAVGGLGLYRAKRVQAEQMQMEAIQKMHDVEAVHSAMVGGQDLDRLNVSEADLPKYEVYKQGAPLSLELFAASQLDRGATQLAAETFRENIKGVEVTWRMRADNLVKSGSGVVGEFSVPYVFHRKIGRSTEHSELRIRCEFGEGSQDKLLEIRRGDWVWVRGWLSVERNSIKLEGARQVAKPVEEG